MALSRLDSQPSILVLDEENECPKCKEFQRQIKDLRERLDAADEPLKHYENLKSQKNWLIKYVTSLTPYKLEENFLLPLVRNPMIRMSFRRFRGCSICLDRSYKNPSEIQATIRLNLLPLMFHASCHVSCLSKFH